jgi:hypothetical protein
MKIMSVPAERLVQASGEPEDTATLKEPAFLLFNY